MDSLELKISSLKKLFSFRLRTQYIKKLYICIQFYSDLTVWSEIILNKKENALLSELKNK
jgi:hypothetical protein